MNAWRLNYEYVWFCPFCDWSLIAAEEIYLIDVEACLEDHFEMHVEEMCAEAHAGRG